MRKNKFLMNYVHQIVDMCVWVCECNEFLTICFSIRMVDFIHYLRCRFMVWSWKSMDSNWMLIFWFHSSNKGRNCIVSMRVLSLSIKLFSVWNIQINAHDFSWFFLEAFYCNVLHRNAVAKPLLESQKQNTLI